ncbi:MAG: hypothetical protein D3910_14065, partial [Candidatus Electrothrix sp. ATG2]|nr:hypothetical protein [Candidatus Electrothrix sp. ATG2]
LVEQVVVLAKLIASNASLGYQGLICEHERDYRSVRLEWAGLTDSSLYTCGLLALMKDILSDMMVHEQRIRSNVLKAAPLISTEALMFFLGEAIGKQNAHTLVYEASMQAVETGKPLLDILLDDPDIAGNFSREEIEQSIAPEEHVGMSRELTEQTITFVETRLQERETPGEDAAHCPLCIEGEGCLCVTV